MATETADFIGQLDQSRPQGSESLGEADDHLRLTKKCLTATMQGGADDAYDTPLIAGPRYLNSLVGKYPNPEDFVTLSTTQTITGAKTFTKDINIGVQTINGQNGEHLISSDATSNYVGFWNKQTTLLSSERDNLIHGYGNGGIDDSAVILTTDNLYEVGDVALTIDNRSPGVRFGGTWVQIAEGRAIFGVGTHTDMNDQTGTVGAGNGIGGEYSHKLSEAEMPAHIHGTSLVSQNQQTGSGYERTRVAATGGVTESTGGDASHNNMPPFFGLYVWQKTAD